MPNDQRFRYVANKRFFSKTSCLTLFNQILMWKNEKGNIRTLSNKKERTEKHIKRKGKFLLQRSHPHNQRNAKKKIIKETDNVDTKETYSFVCYCK